MDFYLDEQLPKRVAAALNELEGHDELNKVFSTEIVFGKGVLDPELFKKLKEVNGILVTNDLKMLSRPNEFTLIRDLGITSFMISLPKGSAFWLKAKTIINSWEEIRKVAAESRHPFIYRIKMRGKSEFL